MQLDSFPSMSGSQKSNSYQNIFKNTTIFGSIHVIQIIINLIRGKFIAIFLGSEGIGINQLFNSAANTLSRFASLGLNLAIVKEVAENKEQNRNISLCISVLSKLIHLTALLGTVVCVLFARQLSLLTFGSESYTWQFILLSIAVFFMIESGGKLAILQGLHEVKRLSKASLVGSLAGLLFGVPLYAIYGNKGIIPSIIIVTFCSFLFYYLNLKKSIPVNSAQFNKKDLWVLTKKLIPLGIVLMASDLIGSICSYTLSVFIRQMDSVDAVGLFQAAGSITTQYSAVIFTVLSLDYLPRLYGASKDDNLVTTIVNRQTDVVVLLLSPLITILILLTPLVIKVLLTESFLNLTPLVRWMSIGILCKAISFPMGYITFAKDNKKLFFWLEGIFGNLLYLICGMIFFHLCGLIGLGYSIVIENIICIIVYYIINHKLYSYSFSVQTLKYLTICSGLSIVCFIASWIDNLVISYILMSIFAITSVIFSIIKIRIILKIN